MRLILFYFLITKIFSSDQLSVQHDDLKTYLKGIAHDKQEILVKLTDISDNLIKSIKTRETNVNNNSLSEFINLLKTKCETNHKIVKMFKEEEELRKKIITNEIDDTKDYADVCNLNYLSPLYYPYASSDIILESARIKNHMGKLNKNILSIYDNETNVISWDVKSLEPPFRNLHSYLPCFSINHFGIFIPLCANNVNERNKWINVLSYKYHCLNSKLWKYFDKAQEIELIDNLLADESQKNGQELIEQINFDNSSSKHQNKTEIEHKNNQTDLLNSKNDTKTNKESENKNKPLIELYITKNIDGKPFVSENQKKVLDILEKKARHNTKRQD